MKHIIVCSDGTGNTAVKDRGTNVFKLFEAADLNGHRVDPKLTPQIAIYGDGVGTEDFKPVQIFALATGWGLAKNVRQLYKEVARNYDPGDKIFLFGFSRGAFTVRTLAGLIHQCGILDMSCIHSASDLDKRVNQAYTAYRKSYRTALMKMLLPTPKESAGQKFRNEHCVQDETKIEFIGVWDTVDAVGTPFHISDIINVTFHRYKFPDRKLNPSVEHACHALAIDEERDAFTPELWDNDSRIEQVWFAGVHSNVGGGYPKQGMSLVALEWMVARASCYGLRLVNADQQSVYAHASVFDHLYNSRSGLGVFYRWLPRDMAKLCRDAGVQPQVHMSVLERIAHGTDDYAPGTLAANAQVAITESPQSIDDPVYKIARDRADRLQSSYQKAFADQDSLLDRVRFSIFFGRISYYLYLAGCTLLLLAAVVPTDETQSHIRPFVILKNAWRLISAAITGDFSRLLAAFLRVVEEPVRLTLILAVLLASWALSRMVDKRMTRVFSEFWHQHQPELRDQLKRSQAAAGGE